MITKIEITDNTRIGKHWVKNLESFKNGITYEFKPGINIIIGENGCGKSTLLDLTSEYSLCPDRMVSEVPDHLLELDTLFDDSGNIYDGFRVHHDWAGGVFKFLHKSELSEKGSDSILRNFENFNLYGQRSSTGEGVMDGLGSLFEKMFSGKTYQFPIQPIADKIKTLGESEWGNRLKSLLKYYQETRIQVTQETFEYTVLMDEPDRNLDIHNIGEIYGILSYHKPQTQIIAVTHNPLLIYKLSKIPEIVNILEMTPGYLWEIIDFTENRL